jgi:HEAT repeat protein
LRDERATPLFAFILRHVDHRGPLLPVYLRAIESLGALRDPEAVPPLKEALYTGEWWAPRRTRTLRSTAAAALARIGTPASQAVLQEALDSGPRSMRAVVRAQLALARARQPRTGAV